MTQVQVIDHRGHRGQRGQNTNLVQQAIDCIKAMQKIIYSYIDRIMLDTMAYLEAEPNRKTSDGHQSLVVQNENTKDKKVNI